MPLNALLPRPKVPFIPAGPYARGIDWLAERGHDRERITEQTGIDPAELARPDGLLTLDQVEAFAAVSSSLVNEHGQGLDFGAGLLFPSHGALGFAGLTAPTLAAATDVAVKYLELVTPLFVLERRVEGEMHAMRLHPRYRLSDDAQRIHRDVILGSVHALAQFGVGRMPAGTEMELPEDHALFRAWAEERGVTLRTGRDVITLRVPDTFMSAPFVLADAKAHVEAIARCEEMLSQRSPEEQTIRDVRRALRDAGPPFLDVEAVSRKLGTSPRTLRRRLDREGASFRELLDEARFSWAARALADSDSSITTIAYDAGYTTPANFTRAFGRVVGMSPSAYRKAERGR